MAEFEIGDKVELNGEEYEIVGTVKRSWLLKKKGNLNKRYKATSKMMKKIQELNSLGIGNTPRKKRQKKSDTYWMERRLERKRIFFPDAKMPETETELMDALAALCSDLSPENLSCDGELSRTQINAKYAAIRGEWREIEKKLGRMVSDEEAERYWMKKYIGRR